MSRLKTIPTPSQFASQLRQLDPNPLSQPAFTAPTTTLSQWGNHSSASNPQNANFVIGWGCAKAGAPFRGLNGSYAHASVHFSVGPKGKQLNWVALAK